MKKITILFLFVSYRIFSQVGIGTATPNGQLDIDSSIYGLVIPRIPLTSRNVAAPVVNPQGVPLISGTLIYNTATAGVSPNNVLPGFYYWDSVTLNWIALAGSGVKNWTLTGNAGTVATTNFIGTTDAVDFVTRTNNTEKTRVTSTGNFGLGINNPNGKLHVFETTGTTLTPTAGTIILEHGNNLGNSSILFKSKTDIGLFKSKTDIGSDYGYIRYSDDGSGNGTTTENSLLEIGIQSDNSASPDQDDIAIMPSGNLGIGTIKPNAKLHNFGTTALTTATSGIDNTVILQDAGSFLTPAPSVNNSGVVYIIRNTSATTDLIVNNIIDFNSTTVANFTLTPALGSIMIVCNGTNWYRIK